MGKVKFLGSLMLLIFLTPIALAAPRTIIVENNCSKGIITLESSECGTIREARGKSRLTIHAESICVFKGVGGTKGDFSLPMSKRPDTIEIECTTSCDCGLKRHNHPQLMLPH